MLRWAIAGLSLLVAPATPAAASPAPAKQPEGPAPPPATGAAKQPEGPANSGAPTTPSKGTNQPEGPAPPATAPPKGPKPRPEGPAQLPEPTGARATSEKPWLQGQPNQASRPSGPEPPQGDSKGPASLGLTRTREGNYLYVDPGKRFTVAINPDGGVRFGDRWGRDQHGQRMKGGGWALRQIGPSGIGMGGPTEWLRALSEQELDAGAKTEFLNLTRELRIQLAVEFTRQLLRTRLGELERELQAISSDASMSLQGRKELLFNRWDECDERFALGQPGAEVPQEALSEIDRDRLAAADTARRTIEAFIRRQHARGSARGYTAAELQGLNKRRLSAQPFAPYNPARP